MQRNAVQPFELSRTNANNQVAQIPNLMPRSKIRNSNIEL
jgi:hypothetical protein